MLLSLLGMTVKSEKHHQGSSLTVQNRTLTTEMALLSFSLCCTLKASFRSPLGNAAPETLVFTFQVQDLAGMCRDPPAQVNQIDVY